MGELGPRVFDLGTRNRPPGSAPGFFLPPCTQPVNQLLFQLTHVLLPLVLTYGQATATYDHDIVFKLTFWAPGINARKANIHFTSLNVFEKVVASCILGLLQPTC